LNFLCFFLNTRQSQAQLIACIDLKHSLSTALPSGYSRQRPHAFALQQANGGVYVFQVGSDEQLVAWISTLNYWAARESKEPLTGGISNMEFGWGDCLQDVVGQPDNYKLSAGVISVTVHEWKPPVPPEVSSTVSEMDHFNALQKHVQQLNVELDYHREIKPKISIRVSFLLSSVCYVTLVSFNALAAKPSISQPANLVFILTIYILFKFFSFLQEQLAISAH
jgi:hypothetical protein